MRRSLRASSVRARSEGLSLRHVCFRHVWKLVREVEVRRPGLEFGCARVDREPAGPRAARAHFGLADPKDRRDPRVGEAETLRSRNVAVLGELALGLADRFQLRLEVRMCAGELR